MNEKRVNFNLFVLVTKLKWFQKLNLKNMAYKKQKSVPV